MNSIRSLVPGILIMAILGCGTEELPVAQRMSAAEGRDAFNSSDPVWSADADDGEEPRFSDWSAPVNLGPVVNSASTDIEVSISRDDLTLYLASNRSGNFDIWVSQRASVDDPGGPPQNLGPTINTSARDKGCFSRSTDTGSISSATVSQGWAASTSMFPDGATSATTSGGNPRRTSGVG